jgi:non-specific serine/threonine protein kinase
MLVTLELLNTLATPDSYDRGRRAFHEGAVALESVHEDFVRADVQGTDLEDVEVRQGTGGLEASCSCAYQDEGFCEHVVAVLLALMYRQAKVSYKPGLLPINARQRRLREQERERRTWIRSIQKLLPDATDEPPPPAANGAWRIAYAISAGGTDRYLFPLRIKIKPDGTDAKATLLKGTLSAGDPHTDLADRILLSKLSEGYGNLVPEDDVEAGPGLPSGAAGATWTQPRDAEWNDLLLLLRGKEVYLHTGEGLAARRLRVEEGEGQLRLEVVDTGEGTIVDATVSIGDDVRPVGSGLVLLAADPLWVLMEDRVFRLNGVTGRELAGMKQSGIPITVPAKDRKKFLHELLPGLLERYETRVESGAVRTVEADPVPRLYLRESEGAFSVELRHAYAGVEVPDAPGPSPGAKMTASVPSGNDLVQVVRRPERETEHRAVLASRRLRERVDEHGSAAWAPACHPLDWLYEDLPALREAGFEVFGQEKLRRLRVRPGRPLLALSVSSGIDWFDLAVNVRFEGSEASLESFSAAVAANERFVRLKDGTFGMLPDEWLKRFRRMLALGTREKGKLRFSRLHVGLFDDLVPDAEEVDTDRAFDEMRERFRGFEGISTEPLPAGFHGELRPYQKSGYDWLHFLRSYGFGGILADDMGLGKTIQTLALFQRLYESGEHAPSLIVVPTSLIFNWQREAEAFTPGLKVLAYRGTDRRELQAHFHSYHLIVTSYGILRRDTEFLKTFRFDTVVLDESQNIKNYASVNARAARALQADHRLALTGTPVENNLTELWSQFSFLNPGMLGGLKVFLEAYVRPIERQKDEPTAAALRRLVYPFILRRTKEIVASELPPKTESITYCEMDADQRTAYEHWREHFRRSILQSIDTVGLEQSRMKVLEGLMKLRLVCCHPVLVDQAYAGSSAKFDAYTEMLEDIIAEGHKVLVFSQFVRMLTVMRKHCEGKGISYEYLDGRTVDREERVGRFQSDDSVRVFLVSLRAGGVGLNLTAADYVVLYDPWWNPAVEAQATDRTHRIGQTKSVFAYKLITKDSVEEKILALQEQKKRLVASIISTDTGFVKSLTREDVDALFS